MNQELLWALEARIIDLRILIDTDDASFLDQWELEELTNEYRYWTMRNKLCVLPGGKA